MTVYSMKRSKHTYGFAVILNLLWPGLGYVYIREILFGLFVFLIALLAAALFFFSLLIPFPIAAKLVLFGLPLVFYAITFIDLARTIKKQPHNTRRTSYAIGAFLAAGLLFQFAAPVSPGNYLLRNMPDIFRVESDALRPFLSEGDIACASALDLRANIFFLDRPLWFGEIEYGDVIRFEDDNGLEQVGIVVGLATDEVQVIDGVLVLNGHPLPKFLADLQLDDAQLPLTVTDPGSILAVTVDSRMLMEHQVPLRGVIGRVHRLF